ncbi:catalytic/ protein phosphatase type 2C [Panicum miliaceum]|uniref:protein-serine/threonine phosphatase n=1 Tax=Panicum miliaceum TaxID=4540 RepID=A0A3L6QEC0_PANMI|nr:catalytic/ protein phosphatase type 2C [Panicum miliaceum]
MWSWLTKIAACLGPVRRHARTRKDEDGSDNGRGGVADDLLWSRDIGRHAAGEFSFAVAQANETLEDHSQVETGAAATFVGVYDGHGGAEASRFISDHLFAHLIRLAQENGTITEDVVRSAFSATEEGFLTLVRRTRFIKPLIAAVGSCCLVGVIWRGTLYVANLGDSRAVVGSLGRSNKIVAEPLTIDHNASVEEVRQELISRHPDDSQIVVLKHGVWRIKGIIQVSRTIGDAYLKRREFALDPSITRFRLPEPLRRPVLTAEPSICTRALHPQDKFIIFATDGLWEHLTNQQAVEIVHNNPRRGIAKRLVRAALKQAAQKREMRYDDLKKVEKGVRRFFHDDITVVVVYIDHGLLQHRDTSVPELSVRGFADSAGPSRFSDVTAIS